MNGVNKLYTLGRAKALSLASDSILPSQASSDTKKAPAFSPGLLTTLNPIFLLLFVVRDV
jgi:hypothetical protein